MKKILFSLMTITVIIAMLGGATLAWFTDTEASSNNTFTAGTLRLGGKIEDTYHDDKFATLYADNMEPGESQVLGPVELKNMGSLPLKIYRISAANFVGDQALAGVLTVEVKFAGFTVFTGKLSDLLISTKGFFLKEQKLEPGEETSMTVIVHMDESADDNYQGNSLVCDLILDSVQTNKTTVTLMDSLGNPLEGASFTYWNGRAWLPLGTTDASGSIGSILPDSLSTTTVQITYRGYTKSYKQNIQEQSHFVFGTAPVTIKLVDSNGNSIPGAVASVSYAADYPSGSDGSYRPLGTTDENGEIKTELLPYAYYFQMRYKNATTNGISYNIVDNPVVIFQTGKVHSESGTCTGFYKSGGGSWTTFVQDMELLPMDYVFRFNDGTPNTTATVVAGQQTNIH